MNGLDHLSYSSISSYLACPRNWSFKYVDKLPTYGTPDLTIGTAIHGAVEEYLRQTERTQEPAKFLSQAWEDALGRGEVFWGTDTPESTYNEALRLVSDDQVIYNLSTITPARTEDGSARIEEKVELRVPGVPIPIIGYIDIQTADGTPADLKTSARSWTQDRAQSETQSLFYLAALNQAGRTVRDWKFRHYVLVKTKKPQFQVLEHAHKPGEIFWLFSMIYNVWRGIQAEVFPENPTGWRCSPSFCDFWTKCRGRWV